jgi:aspartate aminotransferase
MYYRRKNTCSIILEDKRMEISRKYRNIMPSVTLAITAKAKKMKSEGIDVISFSAGEPDFRTPEHIRKAAIDAIENESIGYTPSAGMIQLKEAICTKLAKENNLDYSPENIVVSNGAKHSLNNALSAICNPGDEVIVPVPYWVSYPEMVKMADGVPVFVQTKAENGFKYTIEDLRAAINENTKALILNSPSNPTGAVYTKEELEEIANLVVEKDIFVIADEIYEKLVYEGEHISIASLNDDIKDRTIVINGMSKAYAMTGWRIGYLAAPKEIAKIITNTQSHGTSNPNTVAQYASIQALIGDSAPIEEMRKAFDERRKFMADRINSIEGISCIVPHGAFYIMVNIEELIGKTFNGYEINGSMDFANYLLDNAKVAVIPGAGFGTDNYVRVSYATSLDNIKEGLNRIEKAIS